MLSWLLTFEPSLEKGLGGPCEAQRPLLLAGPATCPVHAARLVVVAVGVTGGGGRAHAEKTRCIFRGLDAETTYH
jgi:hypothetical protein